MLKITTYGIAWFDRMREIEAVRLCASPTPTNGVPFVTLRVDDGDILSPIVAQTPFGGRLEIEAV